MLSIVCRTKASISSSLLHVGARRDLLAAERVHRRLGDDLAGQPHAAAEALAVLLAVEVVEEDLGMLVRVGRADADVAAALRLVRPGQHHEAVALQRLLAVVAHGGGQEVELDVGPLQRGVRADEAAGLEVVGHAEPAPEQHPFEADPELAQRVHPAVQRDRLLAGVLDVDLGMVLQVLADARQVVQHLDARGLEHGARTDPGALQQMRRADRTGRDDHLAAAARGFDLAAALVFDADGAACPRSGRAGSSHG